MTGQISALVREIIDRVYPVHVILDFGAAVDPNSAIGCGTVWTRMDDGRTLIAADGTHPVGWTGGSETVTLTQQQMPRISGRIVIHSAEDSTRASQWYSAEGVFSSSTSFPGYSPPGAAQYTNATSINNIIFSAGGNQPHTNMQPSMAVCRWERTV